MEANKNMINSRVVKWIDDFDAKELDIFERCTEKELAHFYEPNGGIFIAESPNVIVRALCAGYEPVSMLLEPKDIETGNKILCDYKDIPFYTASLEVLSKITGYKLTRGLLCAMKRKEENSAIRICEGKKRIAVLENVMNPTNIGAIFRSAAALNMEAVLLSRGCCDPLYRRSIRVSMGTVFQIPYAYVGEDANDWNENANSILHSLGFKTVAMALRDNTIDIDNPVLRKEERLAIILGTEGEGLLEKTINECDYTVKIPMSHGVDSLNVAAASAVAFWELGKGKSGE